MFSTIYANVGKATGPFEPPTDLLARYALEATQSFAHLIRVHPSRAGQANDWPSGGLSYQASVTTPVPPHVTHDPPSALPVPTHWRHTKFLGLTVAARS